MFFLLLVLEQSTAAGQFLLVNGNSNKCVGVAASDASNGASVYQSTCDGSVGQQWTWSDGTLRNGNDLCVGVTSGLSSNDATVVQWACTGSANQQWTWSAGVLTNGNSNKCVGIRSASTADNALLVQWSCTGSANQRWNLQSPPLMSNWSVRTG